MKVVDPSLEIKICDVTIRVSRYLDKALFFKSAPRLNLAYLRRHKNLKSQYLLNEKCYDDG